MTARPARRAGRPGAPLVPDLTVVAEEQLRVTTERVPATRVRLGKRLVTEDVTLVVRVVREEPVLEELPLDGTEPDGSTEPDDDPPWLVLFEERPAVVLERVPVERARVRVEHVSVDTTVAATLRRERVGVERTRLAPSSDDERHHPGTTTKGQR